MDKVKIKGVEVFPFTSVDELIEHADRNKGILVAVNADKVIWATDETREIINNNIGYCDGAGAVLALKKKGADGAVRIAGCDLWLEIIKKLHASHSFYLIGARKDIHDEVIDKLRREFPGINIVGHRDGYIAGPEERAALIDDVAAKKPDVVFVAMGSPKQELLMHDMMARHKAIYQGLGGSFDVYSGHQSRAPKWWRDHNLEFLYRLMIRPKRIKHDIYKFKFAWWLFTGNY
ncbi:MAG: WecB/TagA/CpsF family glycosyltransferase [Muribaculaceae bacterium]|nr:WecB/TagA/CpsF family glycosyltransferase [Muribaculaceae bacterium]